MCEFLATVSSINVHKINVLSNKRTPSAIMNIERKLKGRI
jgi:hypothetical protein